MRPLRSLSLGLAVVGCAATSGAQDPPSSPLVVPSGTERVEVDLVVRDEEGTLVRELVPREVEVREDGALQEIESFERVDLAARPRGTPAFLALVFDRLGPAARRFARDGALAFLSGERLAGTEFGVFSVDGGLTVLQFFTGDRAALRRAVEGTSSLVPTVLAGERERQLTRNAYHGLGEGFGQAHVASAEQKGAPECRGREEVRIRLTEILESRLVGAMEALPGRKAVVLFSEGLAAPSFLEGTRRAVIAAANGARVSVYTVDAGGLRVASPADEMRRAADALRTRLRASADGGRLTEDSPLVLLERSEDALRQAPGGTLARLAEDTGGFAIQGTNDLSAGLARVEEELRAHYVLSYSPTNRSLDGRFRRISVKVARPRGRVQARRGYLGHPVKRDPGRPLALFLRAWPAADRPAVDARVEVIRGRRTVAAAPPLRLRREGEGRARLVSTFPVESLPPGAYELRVTLDDGRDAETRTASLAIVP